MTEKFYYDKANGTAFFFDGAGELMAAPMQEDDTPDWNCVGYVCDFNFPLGPNELVRIITKVREAVEEPERATVYLRELDLDYSTDELECVSSVNNRYSDGPLIRASIRDVGCIGVAWLVECLSKTITDNRITDDGERACLTMLDKIKNAIAILRAKYPEVSA